MSKGIFHAVIILLFLFGAVYCPAEVVTDKDGNTYITIKGDSKRGTQNDDSEYYLRIRPLESSTNDFCQVANGNLTGFDPATINALIDRGETLINDIKKINSNAADALHRNAVNCHLILLSEVKRRAIEYQSYARQRANEYYNKAAEIQRLIDKNNAWLRSR